MLALLTWQDDFFSPGPGTFLTLPEAIRILAGLGMAGNTSERRRVVKELLKVTDQSCDDRVQCPATYLEIPDTSGPVSVEDLTVVARGWTLDTEAQARVPIPDGESAVRQPAMRILEAADAIRAYIARSGGSGL